MRKCYRLLDCNNFYASCERVFDASVKEKPIVVLSNNDGCVIARSDEAKQIGVTMGSPLFKVRIYLKLTMPKSFRQIMRFTAICREE